MHRTICLLVVLALAWPALAQEEAASPDTSAEALEVLKKVDAAVKQVQAVRYRAVSTPTGIAENFLPPAEGTAVMSGWVGTMPQKFHIDVKTRQRGSGEEVRVTGGGDGDSYFLIDHGTKKAYEDMDPGVMGSHLTLLGNFGMREFVHETPFDDEMKGELRFEGEEEVGGTPCYKVHVTYQGGQGSSTWHFAKTDYLPRRRVRHFEIPGQGKGALETTIYDLQTAPTLDAKLFKLKLPEGYEQIDDFAP